MSKQSGGLCWITLKLTKFLCGTYFKSEDYVYSSAIDYAGDKELLDNIVVAQFY